MKTTTLTRMTAMTGKLWRRRAAVVPALPGLALPVTRSLARRALGHLGLRGATRGSPCHLVRLAAEPLPERRAPPGQVRGVAADGVPPVEVRVVDAAELGEEEDELADADGAALEPQVGLVLAVPERLRHLE